MGQNARPTRLLALIIAVVALGACSGGDNAQSSPGVTVGDGPVRVATGGGGIEDPGPADITIVNFRFEDAEFTTSAGTEITWVSDGAAPHTVTGEGFDSGTIRRGRGFKHTFDEPGEYAYWCKNHPGMEGVVIVE